MGHLSIVFFFWNHQNQESGFEPAESQPNLDIGMVKLRHEELQQVGLSDNDLSMTGTLAAMWTRIYPTAMMISACGGRIFRSLFGEPRLYGLIILGFNFDARISNTLS